MSITKGVLKNAWHQNVFYVFNNSDIFALRKYAETPQISCFTIWLHTSWQTNLTGLFFSKMEKKSTVLGWVFSIQDPTTSKSTNYVLSILSHPSQGEHKQFVWKGSKSARLSFPFLYRNFKEAVGGYTMTTSMKL